MKNNTNIRVIKNLFKNMGITTMWYVGIFAIIIVVLYIIVVITKVDISTDSLVSVGYSTQIYLLVIGIVYPLIYLPHYLSVGITRKQFSIGLFVAAVLISCCLSVLEIPLLLINENFVFIDMISEVAYGTLSFIIGWIAAVGFQVTRFVPIIIGIFCASVLFNGLIFLQSQSFSSELKLLIVFAVLCLIWMVLMKVFKRVVVKC